MVLVAVFGMSLSWLPQHVPTSCIAAWMGCGCWFQKIFEGRDSPDE